MTVRVYRSTDSSAPALEGTAGALAAVLDAILVNGYGSQTAAGWAVEFTGTSKRVYRAASGNRFRLRLDDTGTTEARIVAYESMTDVDTGTAPFPTAAQQSGGEYFRKSSTADGTDRPWLCIASTTAFYFFGYSAQTTYGASASSDCTLFFGDFISYLPGDGYNTLISTRVATGTSQEHFGGFNLYNGGLPSGHFMPRAFTQLGGSVQAGKKPRGYFAYTDTTPVLGYGAVANTYPDPIRGGLLMSPVEITENTGGKYSERGKFPGLWCPHHASPGGHLDTFSGTGSLSGKTFILVNVWSASVGPGRGAIETSDGW